MPNKKASIKHLKQTIKRSRHHDWLKKNIKDILKKGEKAIAAKTIEEKYPELAQALQKAVDKAVKTGILKANTANRKKSRFAARAKKALSIKKE